MAESAGVTAAAAALAAASTVNDESTAAAVMNDDGIDALQQHPILHRHYSTIGIGNVFCDMNPSNWKPVPSSSSSSSNSQKTRDRWLLPSDYLSYHNLTILSQLFPTLTSANQAQTTTATTLGDEIIGQIKSQPEDFVVHEIAMVQGQVQQADITSVDKDGNDLVASPTESIYCDKLPLTPAIVTLPASDPCEKRLDVRITTARQELPPPPPPHPTTEQSSTAIPPSKMEKEDPSQCLESLFQHHLLTVTQQCVSDEDDVVRDSTNDNHRTSALPRSTPEQLRTMLQDMEERALQRMQTIHSQSKYDAETDTLPPLAEVSSGHLLDLTLSYPNDTTNHLIACTDLQFKQHKTKLHEWFRCVHPLLVAESISNGTNKHTEQMDNPAHDHRYYTVLIRIDTTFDGLIPYLNYPMDDLPLLYQYAKNGYDVTTATKKSYRNFGRNTSGRCNDHNNDNSHPILRLLPNLPRPFRRPIHQLIDQQSKSLLGTETVTEYPLPGLGTEDSTIVTTTAIRITWTKMAVRKATKKRQREEMSEINSSGGPPHHPSKTSLSPASKVLCVIKKRQREHLGMINTISAVLKCSPSDIGLAGMKDMQATTFQFGTLNGHAVQKYQQNPSIRDTLGQRGIEIMPLHPVPTPLNKGDLIGNYFEIVVRDVRRVQLEYQSSTDNAMVSPIQERLVPVEDEYFQCMMDRVRRHGFINFYGEQRVGDPGHTSVVGVRAFDIGRAMLQQNYSEAIDLLITGRRMINGIDLVEKNDVEPFRRVWKETNGDAIATAKVLPAGNNSVPRERAVLKGLVRYGTDQPLIAFRCLPRNERLFFINAVRSLSNFIIQYIQERACLYLILLYTRPQFGTQTLSVSIVSLEHDGYGTNAVIRQSNCLG